MTKRTTQVTVMCTFEQTIDIPLELQKDEDAIQELIDEMIASDEMLQNCTDSGEVNRVEYDEYEDKYKELEEEEFGEE